MPPVTRSHAAPRQRRPGAWWAAALIAPLLLSLVACGETDEPGDEPGGAAGAPGALPVEMHVHWEIDRDFPATISIHEAPADRAVYETRSYEAGETPVVGAEIMDGILRAPYSEPRRFIALLENHGDEPVRFWVTPHLPVPYVGEQGLVMMCLCTGEVYEVPAGGSWTRVMEFGVTRRAGLEGPVALTHVVVRGEPPAPPPR